MAQALRYALIAASLVAPQVTTIASARVALPPMTAAQLADYLPDGARVEVRLDTDINGDSLKDVIAIGASEDKRVIRVMLGYINQTDLGYRPVGEGALDTYPLGRASLSVVNAVLIVSDLVGGTTATQSTYRYRYDAKADRMRLIGDDVTNYSRTFQHGMIEISTNRLTGKRLITRSPLAPAKIQAAVIRGKPQLRTVPIRPIYMEEAPLPDDTLESVSGG